MANYSNLVVSRRVTELIFNIPIPLFWVWTSFSFLLSVLSGVPLGFSTNFTGVEDIASWEALLPFSVVAQDFVQSVGPFWIIYGRTVNRVMSFLAYSRSTEIHWLYEGCGG